MAITKCVILGGHAQLDGKRWVSDFNYPEEPGLYQEHIKTAVACAFNSESALVFSGAVTRRTANTMSEARSYYETAVSEGWWGMYSVKPRVLLEENARDSLGNLFYSIATFRMTYGYYPNELIAVGFKFKASRFNYHIKALKWPRKFTYITVNDPPLDMLDRAKKGEAAKMKALASDPFLQNPVWQKQRMERNPLNKQIPNLSSVPELADMAAFLYQNGHLKYPEYAPYYISTNKVIHQQL